MKSEALLVAAEWLGLWSAMAAMGSVACALVYPLFRRLIAHTIPAGRSALTLAFVLTAPVAAVVALVLVLQPDVFGGLVPGHCHGAVCGAHRPLFDAGTLGGAALAGAGSLILCALLGASVGGLRIVRQRLGTLRVCSQPAQEAPYRLVDSAQPLAWCYGLWRTEVFLTRGLVDALSPSQLRAVVLHEQAHAGRRDNLRGTVLRFATLAWPPALRTCVGNDLATDNELACDAAVLRTTGDAGAVQAAILALQGPIGATTHQDRASAFAPLGTDARLAALDHPLRQPTRALYGQAFVAVLWFVLVTLGVACAHFALERISSFTG